ncbi:hypothetical protein [Dialister sp.]
MTSKNYVGLRDGDGPRLYFPILTHARHRQNAIPMNHFGGLLLSPQLHSP